MILGRIWCRLVGHKWRRLTVKERGAITSDGMKWTTPDSVRICRRCGEYRVAKARKPKVKIEQEAT